MKPVKLLYATVLSLTILTGCGQQAAEPTANNGQHEQHEQHKLPNGDIQEVTTSTDILPSFLNGKDPRIILAYQTAAKNNDLLQWIPCYCGCGDEAGHINNGNCFINEVKEDGSVVWDDHGTRCGTCMEIAVVSSKLKEEGKTDKEIRDIIDNHYKADYAPPTPTPMPQG
jgi:Protein of unknown function with PCYCGC motif